MDFRVTIKEPDANSSIKVETLILLCGLDHRWQPVPLTPSVTLMSGGDHQLRSSKDPNWGPSLLWDASPCRCLDLWLLPPSNSPRWLEFCCRY
ncbi:hypothetical protein Y1Q_0015195 [Alligator mississippiensis]|uniref:Uncharacterized protein n=1 Tax=Alligator mississippiensis TaxID=8496 RepID=A0A151P8Z8_ALLMI|nr:hypothetical protein Y1Q_0015195 [Alligator mississippiensis]